MDCTMLPSVTGNGAAPRPATPASVSALLMCPICHKLLSEPCLLDCCHTFCAACLRSAAAEPGSGFVACPTCGAVSGLNAGPGLPAPLDPVAAFLVHRLNAEPVCANCDRRENSPVFYCNTCLCLSDAQWRCCNDDDDEPKRSDNRANKLRSERMMSSSSSLSQARQLALCLRVAATQPLDMFFCRTCGQALCSACRDETHRARMFAQHEIVHISMAKTNEDENELEMCNKHPGLVARLFCTANRSAMCELCLDTSTIEVRASTLTIDRAYEEAKRKLDRALISLAELHTSVAESSSSLSSSASSLESQLSREKSELLDLMRRLQESLSARLESTESSREAQLRHMYSKLHTTQLLLPTMQLQLLLAALFVQRAPKLAFLRIVDHVLERLATLAQMAYPLSLTEEVSRDDAPANSGSSSELRSLLVFLLQCLDSPNASELVLRKSSEQIALNSRISELQTQLTRIRHVLSLLHADISTQQCISRPQTLLLLKELCLRMKSDHQKLVADVETQKKSFAERWSQVVREKEAFKLQLIELRSLMKDLDQIMAISDHLHSFMSNGIDNESNDAKNEQVTNTKRTSENSTMPRARSSRSECSPLRVGSSKSSTLGRSSKKLTRKLSASSEDITPVKESMRSNAKRGSSKKSGKVANKSTFWASKNTKESSKTQIAVEKEPKEIKTTNLNRAQKLPLRRYSAPTDLDDDDADEVQQNSRRRWPQSSRSLDFLLSDSTSEPEEAVRSGSRVQRVVAEVHASDALRKTDSFEGHEQTVANLVESVMRSKQDNANETGTIRRRTKNFDLKPSQT